MNTTSTEEWENSIEKKERFEFGENWINFLNKLSNEHIEASKDSMNEFLTIDMLKGKSFIDIGSGSGLHSLVAAMQGAKVFSFDYDYHSFLATSKIKEKYLPDYSFWEISQGSVLDDNYMNRLPRFDIVYSWGVLHHTGSMWNAISNATKLVENNGHFFIAIYNNQRWKSRFWWFIKFLYNKLPKILQKIYAILLGYTFIVINLLKYTIMLKPGIAIEALKNYKKGRGMNMINDMIDWIGGFPYEYATVKELDDFFKKRGFELIKVKEASSLGCHQIIFKKIHNYVSNNR
jgi:2-polyprenyl-3-methyl-5-hydroxy-6-metoxy-1,4-benzoquinol methylase